MTVEPGQLYLVATPIGNLEDITLRALRVLKEVDLIAAEDTRRTKKLLNHFEITTPLTSYHSFNEHRKTQDILNKVVDGASIAVVSDAGTPALADPGFLIVREALAQDISPIVIPGVSSLTFSVTAAGLPVDKFSFYGFLPVKSGRRGKLLDLIAESDMTSIVFESPHRMEKLLKQLVEHVGADVSVAVIREATKVHEEVLRGTAADLVEQTAGRTWKGECVVVINR